jgi:Rod binding domain-containing protein
VRIPQVPPQNLKNQNIDTRSARERASPEMIQAAENMEAHFTEMMMKAMRETVEDSEFSLHNSATNIYQSMLDDEYSQTSARVNPLGLSDQILDYLLRSQPNPQYTKGEPIPQGRTGGTTNESESSNHK